jgi:hypothetical protein
MIGALAGADAGARAAAVLGLQGRVANSGLSRLIARQGDHPEGGGTPARTGDEIQDALQELRDSGELIDRNTAERVDSGAMSVMYLGDLETDPESDALLDGWGFDKTQFVVRLSPAGARMVVQTNAQGTLYKEEDGTTWLFVARGVGVARMRTILVHETNHAMRLDEGSTEAADSFERYQDEFQAYWVAEFREVADLDDRASQIRAHILRDYPAVRGRYDTDEDFKALVDAYTRPDANVLNSERWRRIEEAAGGLGTDEAAIFAAIQAMSPEEREAARGDPNFMSLLRDELSGEDLERALLLLDGVTELTNQALDAMSGLGTDEDALFGALQAMSTDEKLVLRRNAGFMARLHDDLSGDELQRALELLEVPMGDYPVMTREEKMA